MKWRQLAFDLKLPPAKYIRPHWLKALLTMPFVPRPTVEYKQLPLPMEETDVSDSD